VRVGSARQSRGRGGPLCAGRACECAVRYFAWVRENVTHLQGWDGDYDRTVKYGDITGAIPNRQLPSENEETARAIGDVVVRVHAHELRAAMEVNPRLAVIVAEYLAKSKRSAEWRVFRAMTQSVDRRVIETLVELAGSVGARCPHGFSLEIRLTQQDIADLVGASRPVVSSILSGLRKRGLLNYTRDMICVNDNALSLFARSLGTSPKEVSSI
jgi:CRP/FNR family transcriptional regulator, cyclic AMP receptor protein